MASIPVRHAPPGAHVPSPSRSDDAKAARPPQAGTIKERGNFHGRAVDISKQIKPISGYVRLQDRKGHRFEGLHWINKIAGGALCVPGVGNVVAQLTGTSHWPSVRGGLVVASALTLGFRVVAPEVQKLCSSIADRVNDRREVGRLRDTKQSAAQQLERIAELANAQPLVRAGVERSLEAMLRLQEAQPEQISAFDVGRALVTLVGRAVPVLTDTWDEPISGIRLSTPAAINFIGVGTLCDVVLHLHTVLNLRSADTLDLLIGIARECQDALHREGRQGAEADRLRDSAGRWFVQFAETVLAPIPSISAAERSEYLERLLTLPALVSSGSFSRMLDLTRDAEATTQAQLAHVVELLRRAPEDNEAPIQVALGRCAELLRADPTAYLHVAHARAEIRAAHFLRERLGQAISAAQDEVVGRYIRAHEDGAVPGPMGHPLWVPRLHLSVAGMLPS